MAAKVTKLLTIDSDPKTIKGVKEGFMTAVMYLAPYEMAGINVCAMADLAGCWKGCLNTAGRGGMAKAGITFDTPAGPIPDNAIQRCRIRRTRMYADDPIAFMSQLHEEVRKFIVRAEKRGLIPVVRLNGTSDLWFERIPCGDHPNIMSAFPDVQFYDYTKIAKRFAHPLPANYYLCLSNSHATAKYMQITKAAMLKYSDVSLVTVVRNEKAKARITAQLEALGLTVVNGDDNDLRFRDPAGAHVLLKAKGKARKDTSGFVIDDIDELVEALALAA